MPTLDWIGKKAVVNHHREVPYHLLRCDEKLSVGDPGSGNLLVEGDNLFALKALLPYYAGQVKCIYIDPPYNTGKEDWVYNDNVSSPEIRKWLGRVVGKEAEDLSRHDKWLCMMYPRIRLLRNFLKRDGVILVSIDDNEIQHLRILMDEVFGRNNFIAQLVWDKTRKNDAKFFSVGHEYVVIYANSRAFLRQIKTKWRESKPGADAIAQTYHELKQRHGDDYDTMTKELRAWYKSLDKKHLAKKYSRYKHVDQKGIWRDRDISWPGGGGPTYDVIHPVTGKPCAVPEAGWRFATPESMQEQVEEGLVVFREDESKPPFRKAYLFDPDNEDGFVGAQVMPSVFYKQAQVTVRLLRNLFGGQKVFDNPKDHEVLMRLINYVTSPGDIILDSFAGSGSTGHAVLQLNRDPKQDRRFILVEMDENIAHNITSERLKRVVNGYEYKEKGKLFKIAPLHGGFRYTRLSHPIFDESGQIHPEVTFGDLAAHVFFTETGEPIPKMPRRKKGAEHPSPLLGVCNGVAVYLLFNGILGDKRVNGGNVLTGRILAELPLHDGPKVIYGEGCRLGATRLKREGIVFKQLPYEIKVS